MPCNGTYTCLTGQTYSCTGNDNWSCGSQCGAGQTAADNCYYTSDDSGCSWDMCCTIYYPDPNGNGMCTVTGPCTASCPGTCHSCCGNSGSNCPDYDNVDFEEDDPMPCACYTITTQEVTSGTGNPGNLGDCRLCHGTSGTSRCRNMCDDHCGSNYGTSYSSQECIDSDGNVRGDNGTVYPARSYSNCASNWCWEHNACSCDCLTPVTIEVEVVNGPYVGCTDVSACNHDPSALCDDDTCDYSCYGCTDPGAENYDAGATIDDGGCTYYEAECTDPEAYNCDPLCDSCEQGGTYNCESTGNCDYPMYGCTDPAAMNYDGDATETCDGTNGDISCDEEGPNCCCEYEEEDEKPKLGCTDPEAVNYNPEANVDDGSCLYEEDSYICEGTISCQDYYDEFFVCPEDFGCVTGEPPIPPPPDEPPTAEGEDEIPNEITINRPRPRDVGGPLMPTGILGEDPNTILSVEYYCNELGYDNYVSFDVGPAGGGGNVYFSVWDGDSWNNLVTSAIEQIVKNLICSNPSSSTRENGSRTTCTGTIDCFDVYANSLQCLTNEPFNCEFDNQGGCTDSDAYNYDSTAQYDDGTCIYYPLFNTDGNVSQGYETYVCQVWTMDLQDFYCRVVGYELPHYPWDILLVDSQDFQLVDYIGLYITITTNPPNDGSFALVYDFDLEYWYAPDGWDGYLYEEETTTGCTNEYAYNYDSGAEVDDGSCKFLLNNDGEGHTLKMAFQPDEQYLPNGSEDSFRVEHVTFINTPEWMEDPTPIMGSNNFGLSQYYGREELVKILTSRGPRSSVEKIKFAQRLNKTNRGIKNRTNFENFYRELGDDDETTTSRNECSTFQYVESSVMITEIMHSPRVPGFAKEYVEIYNSSGTAVDISGWKFVRGFTFTFPEGTSIQPYDHIIIGRPTQLPCSEDYPFTCPTACLNDSGESVMSDEEGTCHYFLEYPDDEVDHPLTGDACGGDGTELGECYNIPESYIGAPRSHVLENPQEYGLVYGETLFEWDRVTSSGKIVKLNDSGEDILLRDSTNNNIDCVNYKGWLPPVYDIEMWPLVKAGLFGGASIELYKGVYSIPGAHSPNPDDSSRWYAHTQPYDVTAEVETTPGTPGSLNQKWDSSQDNTSFYNSSYPIDLNSLGDINLSMDDSGEFRFNIGNVGFNGFVNANGGVSGGWSAMIPGYGANYITGHFALDTLDWNTEEPPEEDDCGVLDGDNDCSLCNEENGYQCDTCECSGCTDPDALNYGVWWYGNCIENCVGSGNCNFLFNICSGEHNSPCYSDEDCIFTGYKCSYPSGGPNYNLNCDGSGNNPNPDEFGCSDNDECTQINTQFEPLFDDGSCQYEEPIGILDARIIERDDRIRVLQMRLNENSRHRPMTSIPLDNNFVKNNKYYTPNLNKSGGLVYKNNGLEHYTTDSFKVEKIKGNLAKQIDNARRISKKLYKQNPKNKSYYRGNYWDDKIVHYMDEAINRDEVLLAGVQFSLWSPRCIRDNYFAELTNEFGWFSDYNAEYLYPPTGKWYGDVLSFFMSNDQQNILPPIAIGSEYVDVVEMTPALLRQNIFISRKYNCDETSPLPNCDDYYIVAANDLGEQFEVIVEEGSFSLDHGNCSSGGGGTGVTPIAPPPSPR